MNTAERVFEMKFSITELQVILDNLSKGSYFQVAPIIESIKKQYERQANALPTTVEQVSNN